MSANISRPNDATLCGVTIENEEFLSARRKRSSHVSVQTLLMRPSVSGTNGLWRRGTSAPLWAKSARL